MNTSCKRCPNGSFVAFDKAPGKYHRDCKSCPLGKTDCLDFKQRLLYLIPSKTSTILRTAHRCFFAWISFGCEIFNLRNSDSLVFFYCGVLLLHSGGDKTNICAH